MKPSAMRAIEQEYTDTAAKRGRWQSMDGGVDGHAADDPTDVKGAEPSFSPLGAQCGIAAVSRVSVVKSDGAVFPVTRAEPQPAAGIKPGPSTPSMSGAGASTRKDEASSVGPLDRNAPAAAHPSMDGSSEHKEQRVAPVVAGVAPGPSTYLWLIT